MVATAAGSRQQQQQEEEEQLLASCLALLDIKSAEGAKSVDISPTMFRKPNAKAFELILYHAFCVTKGKGAAKKNFRGLWPLLDKDRKQSKEFYQKIQDWLKESGQLTDHSLAAFQRNPAGPKLVTFLCDLVHSALEVQHARMYSDDTVEQPEVQDTALLVGLSEPLLRAAAAHNQLQVERLVGLCRDGTQVQQQAEDQAGYLKETFYELTAQIREQRDQQGTEEQQPPQPSIKLASILPAQLSSGIAAAAAAGLPADLQQSQQEVQQLWQQVEAYVQEFEGLRSMVQHLAGSSRHPYAIDAMQLRAYGQAGGLGDIAAAPGAALDVAALVEAWLFDIGSVCRYLMTLAGHTANLEQQQDNQQRGWLPVRPGGIGRCRFMSPLVATSDAASHATHLYAQLSLHRSCRDAMLGLTNTLSNQTEVTAARMQQLEGELAPLYEQQVAQAQLAAEAMAAAAAADAEAEAEAASAAADSGHHMDGLAPAAYTAQASAAPSSGYGASASGLFSGSHLQLVPPTPMLQQQVAKQQRRLQHRAAEQQAHMGVGSTEVSQQHMPAHQHLLPLNLSGTLPHQGGAVEVSAAAARGGGGSDESLSPVMLPEAINSPVLQDSGPGSPLSTASSSALPAAELLMSRELMDLDLVDYDAAEEDDGGIFPQHIMATTGQARSPGCGVRISYARFSLGTDSLSPLLARAARHQDVPQQQDKASRDLGAAAAAAAAGGGGGGAAAGATASASSVCESAEGAPAASWRGLSLSGKGPTAGASPSSSSPADLDTQHVQDGQDTPKCDWANTAAAVQHHHQHSPGGAASSAGGAGAAAAAGGIESGKSPCTVENVEQHAQLQQPGSAECLSSAKPRRLTFAAAASVDSRGSTSMLAPHAETPLLDTGSSFSISSGEDAGDDAQSAAANSLQHQQQQAASDTMAALRQRFAQMRGER